MPIDVTYNETVELFHRWQERHGGVPVQNPRSGIVSLEADRDLIEVLARGDIEQRRADCVSPRWIFPVIRVSTNGTDDRECMLEEPVSTMRYLLNGLDLHRAGGMGAVKADYIRHNSCDKRVLPTYGTSGCRIGAQERQLDVLVSPNRDNRAFG